MTWAQILSFSVIGGAVAVFIWGRFRYDLVALVALLVGIITGDVSAKQAFGGFTSDVVVIIASALIVSAAIARSGIVETLVRPLLPHLQRPRSQVPALAGATALLSMLTKNVGALAILMPTAIRLGRSKESSASSLLMPMAFMSLLGGLVTLVGTSTNIIVSQVREDTLGKPFQMFDFAPVGLTLTLIGLAFVSVGWRLLPRDRKGRTDLSEIVAEAAYSTEAKVPADWPEGLATVADLGLDNTGVHLAALISENGERSENAANRPLSPGAVLILEGNDEALDQLFARLPLVSARANHALEKAEPSEETRSVEAVVQVGSPLIGSSAKRLNLQEQYGVKLLAVHRQGEHITQRLRDVTLTAGDVLVLQAGEKHLSEAITAMELLPLAQRMVKIGDRRQRFGPIVLLAVAIVLIGFKVVPVVTGFFGAAVLVVLVGALSVREAYGALEPEVLVLIGALTPLSEAVQHSGGTGLIAQALAGALVGAPAIIVLGALLVAAMACSPFLHNAPTVLVLGPIGVAVAERLHLSPDPFLMAVATGAGCDFLTPIGHQCNTLVMGPGGYRFGDYRRLGLPLSILVIVCATPLIAHFWPLGT